MPFQMQPARTLGSAGNVPDVVTLGSGTLTCEKGRVLKNNGGVAELHGLVGTTTGIYGVSLEAVASGTADGPDSDIVHIARAERETEFVSKVVDSSGVIQTDLSSVVTVGTQYGLLTEANQDYVDKDETGDKVVTIKKIDDDLDIVWFAFMPASLDPAE